MDFANASIVNSMNRKDRRRAERMIRADKDPERVASELSRMQNRNKRKRPSFITSLIKFLRRPDYYKHIPKQVRPMVCIGYKCGDAIFVADHVKCEKLRRA